MLKISDEEARYRFQKLRNFENVMYPNAQKKHEKLLKKIQELSEENERLREENKQIEKLRLELEELKEMKFGSSKKHRMKSFPISLTKEETKEETKEKIQRSKESYRRILPTPESITDSITFPLESCPECNTLLSNKKEHIHYREDLTTVEELIKSAKKIVQTIIESGTCSSCKKTYHGFPIPKQKVLLGQNLRMMIVYLLVVQGLTYSEVQKHLKSLYHIHLSSGEIINILEQESNIMTPYYNSIIDILQEEGKTSGCHYDETTWNTQSQGKEISEGNYCWIKTGVESGYCLYWFGCSRGKQVAENLRGEKQYSKGISDDYGSYKNLFEIHQLCWAHPHRKLRDLAESTILKGKTQKHCQRVFKEFSEIYRKCRKLREKLLETSKENHQEQKNTYEAYTKLFEQISEPHPDDPDKLRKIKESLQKNQNKYFTFFEHPSLPLDNNKAERSLRKIVIKRKKSFGSKSQHGANILSILYSTVFSILGTSDQDNFFTLYSQYRNWGVAQ